MLKWNVIKYISFGPGREMFFSFNLKTQISQNWRATKIICPSYESLREWTAIPFWADLIHPHLPKRGSCCRELSRQNVNSRHQVKRNMQLTVPWFWFYQKLNPEIYFHTFNSTFFVHFWWKMVRNEKLGEASSAPQKREGPPRFEGTSTQWD